MDSRLLENFSRITPEEKLLLTGQKLNRDLYTNGRDFIIDCEHLLAENESISIRPHTRFVAFPPHSHNYVEIIYMCSGKLSHTINGEHSLVLRAGELLLLNQHVSHSIEKAETEDIAVNFLILPEFFDFALEIIGLENILGHFLIGSLKKGDCDAGYLHFKVSDVPEVQNLVENMVRGIVEKGANYRRINQVTMGLLFLKLLTCTSQLESGGVESGSRAMVAKALGEIEENCKTAELGLVAQKNGISAAYLSRLVHIATGYTFKDLLQQKRLTKAARMLLSTDLTVGEIIDTVGYNNTSYFYRIFKERFGVVPKEYRKNAIKAD